MSSELETRVLTRFLEASKDPLSFNKVEKLYQTVVRLTKQIHAANDDKVEALYGKIEKAASDVIDLAVAAHKSGKLDSDDASALAKSFKEVEKAIDNGEGNPSAFSAAGLKKAVERLYGDLHRASARTKTAKTSMEPHVVRSALAMLEEMKEAEARLRKAVQFSRALRIEPSLEWIVDQLEEAHQSCEGVVKTTEDTLDYLNRR